MCFFGLSATQKGYKCYDPLLKKLYVSRDVRFIEGTPYFTAGTPGDVSSEFFPLPSIENTNQLLSTVTSIDGVFPSPNQHTQSSTGFIPSIDGLGPRQLLVETTLASNLSSNILQQHHSQTDQQIQLPSASDSNRF